MKEFHYTVAKISNSEKYFLSQLISTPSPQNKEVSSELNLNIKWNYYTKSVSPLIV